MKSNKSNLDLAQQLMLFQGVSLIQDGLQFIERSDLPNEVAVDAFLLLRYRFGCLKDCIFDGDEYGDLIIDKMEKSNEILRIDYKSNKDIQQLLEELRKRITKKE